MSLRIALCAAAVVCVACPAPQKPTSSAPPACGDVNAWRSWAIARGDGPTRTGLEKWQPGRPVAEADRAAVLQVAREHLVACGTEEAVAIATRLISFQTVASRRDAGAAPEFEKMGAYLREWATQHEMTFRPFGQHDAWEISLGDGPAGIGFVMHGDVVPASDAPPPEVTDPKGAKPPKGSSLPPGWTHAPFAAERVGDRLYGRGSEDDKGPIAAALVVMDTLNRFGLKPSSRLVAIIGNGEEHDWEPMKAYVAQTPPPKFAISVDGSFPLVIAESGWVGWHLTSALRPGKAIRCAEITDARGGDYLNAIPGEASVRLRAGAAEGPDALLVRAKALAAEEASMRGPPVRAEAFRERDLVVLKTFGTPHHASEPEKASNPLWPLAKIVSKLGVCEGGVGTLLRVVSERFDGDHYGTNLRLGYADPVQGQLVLAATVLKVENGVARLGVNLRRPGGMSNADFVRRLDEVTAELGRTYGVTEDIKQRIVGDPHVADLKGPLVSTLLEIYRRESGDKLAQPKAMRGGTYARLFPGAVSFGPSLPNKPYVAHAADEYIELPALAFQLRVLMEAAVQLDPLVAKTSK